MNYYLKVIQNYADFNGRARRSEYWYFALFNGLVVMLLTFVGASMEFPLITVFYYLAVMIPSIAVAVRRMHDVGKSGWYILIPIYNLILALTEGQRGDNPYGPDPKATSAQ